MTCRAAHQPDASGPRWGDVVSTSPDGARMLVVDVVPLMPSLVVCAWVSPVHGWELEATFIASTLHVRQRSRC